MFIIYSYGIEMELGLHFLDISKKMYQELYKQKFRCQKVLVTKHQQQEVLFLYIFTRTSDLRITYIPCCSFQNVWGVMLGGFLGHSLCTGLAVMGGRFIAQRISVRTGKFLSFSLIFVSSSMLSHRIHLITVFQI